MLPAVSSEVKGCRAKMMIQELRAWIDSAIGRPCQNLVEST